MPVSLVKIALLGNLCFLLKKVLVDAAIKLKKKYRSATDVGLLIQPLCDVSVCISLIPSLQCSDKEVWQKARLLFSAFHNSSHFAIWPDYISRNAR